MKYNELQASSQKRPNRVGRGIAAGQGKTAGRGTKGQNSRGSGTRPGFEGGQNPLMQRLPKLRGFHAVKPKAETVYTSQLDQFSGGIADNFSLANAGILSSAYVRAKVVVKGEISKKVQVKLQGASANAIAVIQKAGGTFEKSAQVGRSSKKTDNDD